MNHRTRSRQSIDILQTYSYSAQVAKTDISFQNLCYTSKCNQKKNQEIAKMLPILQDITGICPGGQMTAILGPSGAGKTSLLNALANTIEKSSRVCFSGEVKVNGKQYDSQQFSDFGSYVMQTDCLLGTMTPREIFEFVVELKYTDSKQKLQRVDDTIKALRLQDCQHTIIGSAYNMGLSGGERKRTTIGYEIVKDPKCILLDEPTSGLDSFTAFIIMDLLRKLCLQQNKTVIFTIHQPSPDIYELFDRIMIIANGRFVYQGPKSQVVVMMHSKILDYFSQQGFQCLMYSNPMDYFISLIHNDSDSNLESFTKHYDRFLRPVVVEY